MVSLIAFAARPPDLHLQPLMDKDFAVIGPLVRLEVPSSGFCTSGRDCRSGLPSDPASRRRPCPSLGLHLHQVGQRTFTSKLLNMPSTQLSRYAAVLASAVDA